jgi:hypothetical protein
MNGADGVKVAVFREGRANSEFFLAAAHARVWVLSLYLFPEQ